MSEKRRDNRNRILREGEYQRKDGRYRFRYLDEDGKEQNVYSWRLDKNDPMPKGKKREPSLREKEKQIEADLFDHIVTNGGKLKVLELVEKYVSLKTGVRHNTCLLYTSVCRILSESRSCRLGAHLSKSKVCDRDNSSSSAAVSYTHLENIAPRFQIKLVIKHYEISVCFQGRRNATKNCLENTIEIVTILISAWGIRNDQFVF